MPVREFAICYSTTRHMLRLGAFFWLSLVHAFPLVIPDSAFAALGLSLKRCEHGDSIVLPVMCLSLQHHEFVYLRLLSVPRLAWKSWAVFEHHLDATNASGKQILRQSCSATHRFSCSFSTWGRRFSRRCLGTAKLGGLTR